MDQAIRSQSSVSSIGRAARGPLQAVVRAAQPGVSAVRARAAASDARRGARPRARRRAARARRHRRALAGAGRVDHRPRSRPRARRARDLRRAAGRRADAAPRLLARARTIASSSSKTSSRPADRRARRWPWRRPRARRSSAPARSSIAAAATPTLGVPFRALVTLRCRPTSRRRVRSARRGSRW